MIGKAVVLGRPIVTVMQPAQAIMRKHAPRARAASSAPRRSLSQCQMRAVFVMVGDVLGKEQGPPRRGGCMTQKLLNKVWDEGQAAWCELKSEAQRGSAAKAAFRLWRVPAR
jgi:hypothetical protein